METKIKMGTTGHERCHTEARTWEATAEVEV
jgi:hypothetical protein